MLLVMIGSLSLEENCGDISHYLIVLALWTQCPGFRIPIQGFPFDSGEGPSFQILLHCQTYFISGKSSGDNTISPSGVQHIWVVKSGSASHPSSGLYLKTRKNGLLTLPSTKDCVIIDLMDWIRLDKLLVSLSGISS